MGVKLDNETRARLKKLAEDKKRFTHWQMKEAINQHLRAEEQHEQENAENLARWQCYLETGTHVTHEDMMSRLDEQAKKTIRKDQAE
jgi:predicted transcriptional regulator